MLPSPSAYSGPFPPRDPRFPALGRYPEIVGGSNVAEQAHEAWKERSAPLREIAYARTGRDASTQASPETAEMASGSDEPDAGPQAGHHEADAPGFMSGARAGWKHFFRPGLAGGYGLGAAGASAAGMTLGLAKGAIGHMVGHGEDPLGVGHESDEEPAKAEPEEPKPQEAIPAYLQDRGEHKPKKLSTLQKERIRIREQAAMTGEHPFHPWRK